MASHIGYSTITKCLEKGLFWDEKSVKNGSKCAFPKIPLDYLGCTNKWNEPHFEPMLSNFGPSQG